ncbi:MAG: hypothetical protein ACJAZB_000945 [Psychrosphaera sp.]
MSQSVQVVNPQLCPLCAKDNACGNLVNDSLVCDPETKQTCWCQNPKLQFPPELLQQVPDAEKNKSCICQACATSFIISR